MKKTFVFLLPFCCNTFIVRLSAQNQNKKRLSDYVNPFIGTGAHGHTYPGATLPFGMVQLSPDNVNEGWDWSSGYNYSDSIITGFSHTHLSGTGIGDKCDISVMPLVNLKPDTLSITSKFNHKNEKASPGFYCVLLEDFNIEASFTTTIRCGLHQYIFPKNTSAAIRFDLGFKKNWDWTTKTFFKQLNDSTFIGYRFSDGWGNGQQVYFAARTSKPIKSLKLFENKKLINKTESNGWDTKAYLEFNTIENERILLKVAISMANTDGALKGLEEITGWDFEKVKSAAQRTWEDELGKITIEAKEDSVKQLFYTSLYHTYLAPTIFSDANGNYKGADNKIHRISNESIYSTHSLWDVFRAASPLLTITQPKRVQQIINSYLAFYDQYGLLPVWDLAFYETGTMTGYHAVPVIADAILKDLKGFDVNKAYVAMKKSSMQNIRATDFYRQYKYIPHDKANESVTSTLEYAYDDWCIAQVAKKMKNKTDADYYFTRANYYKNLFDTGTGFFRPKLADGKWKTPFDSYSAGGEHNAYTEGNAWQHTFFVPHDIKGLSTLYKKANGLVNKLDSLFTVTSTLTGNLVNDVTGLIGQYAHGNEPSHHIAYMYSFLGQPYKTANIVRRISLEQYQNSPTGLSGNEDCGQMSAWYIFSALGFYPCNPSGGEYVFGSPLIDKASIKVGNNKIFKIQIVDNDAENKYIQFVCINGKPYTKTYITHNLLMRGGDMKIKMGSSPNKLWGKDVASFPTSMSDKINDK